MLLDLESLATSVLLIDGSKNQRAYWADERKRCSLDYEIKKPPTRDQGLSSTNLDGSIAWSSNSRCPMNWASGYW